MIFLKDVTIGNYKCFYEPQTFSVEPKTTVLVGMNESGKTALFEAIAKTNYFTEDENFIFHESLEFPRKELKAYQKSKNVSVVVECKYEINGELKEKIVDDLGEDVLLSNEFEHLKFYDNSEDFVFYLDKDKFLKLKLDGISKIGEDLEHRICNIKDLDDIGEIKEFIVEQKNLEAGLASIEEELKSKKEELESIRIQISGRVH